jgi:predicted transcriptional regulator
MVSAKAYTELQAFRQQFLQQEIAAGMADIKAGRVAAGKDVMQRMKERIRDAGL